MSFKKLDPILLERLNQEGIENPLPLQSACLGPIKGGGDFYVISPEGSGKTISLIISALRVLDGPSIGDNPRVMIFVEDKKAALELEDLIKPYIRGKDLRVFIAIDQHDPIGQKDMIYDGIDILIGTPQRLRKLHHMNGFNLAELKLLAVEDAQLLDAKRLQDIISINESISRVQCLVFANEMLSRFEKLSDTFMAKARVIS